VRLSHVLALLASILGGAAFGLVASLGRGTAPHWVVLTFVGAVYGAILGSIFVIARVRANRRARAAEQVRPGSIVLTAIIDRDSMEVLDQLASYPVLPSTVTLVVSDVGVSILTGPTDTDQIVFSLWQNIGAIGMGTVFLSGPASNATTYDRIAIEFLREPNSTVLQVGLIWNAGFGRYYSLTDLGNTLEKIARKAGREFRRAPTNPI
jgi:hypothetical protein